ncbi:S-layer homology domain-containing protein [Deinococcus sonorensis]|uniref:S-layer homology domain-containing protein n=2 Tax=Deinococcus sonorensis TaxID=309891 RepID=A0AAU7UCB8_9DEIO
MKKSLLVLTAALSFGIAAAQTDTAATTPQVPTLTDVPAGHWAKDAIDKIVAQGIILGYPDGTFRGTQNLTRYEAAVIIARLLDQIGNGTGPALDADTMTSLQNAVQELAADLAALGVRVSDLEENAVSQDDFARLEARVEELAGTTGDSAALDTLTQQLQDVNARADDLQANYDTLRADVDDNASSIAALNDLTVLLNNDILGLQDRVSALEGAQGDFVTRADFDSLAGRVGTVETSVTSLNNRVTTLEKYAFSVKPSLTATYFVSRASRNFDVDRLLAGTAFSTGDDGDAATVDTPVDYADFTGSGVLVNNNFTATIRDNTTGVVTTVTGTGDPADYVAPTGSTLVSVTPNLGAYGFATGPGAAHVEGQTALNFTIDFTNSGSLGSGTSGKTGWLVPSAGGLNVNKLDVTFGVRAGYPSDATTTAAAGTNPAGSPASAVYPDLYSAGDGNTYRPLFFYFKNATANFTVGNTPVIVDFGRGQKFKFGDYLFDNDKTGRGDGFIVTVDGSTLPVFGAFKPIIKAVYGSKSGANSDNLYYRGVRAQITPIGTLTFGIHAAQEGGDAFATGVSARDVTAFGADLHGAIAGFQVDSEYALSRIKPYAGDLDIASEYYIKTSGSVGPVKIYDLNYRTVTSNYGALAGIMEANPTDTDNGSTAPYKAGRSGFGAKIATVLGPVAVGAYVNNSVGTTSKPFGNPFATATDPTAIVERGASARVSLFNLVTVRGGFEELLTGTAAPVVAGTAGDQGSRYSVRADVSAPFALSLGAYYRHVSLTGTRGGAATQSDNGLFQTGVYNSYFAITGNDFTNQSGCGDQHPGINGSDVDAVGGALTFSQASFSDKNCYTEYGVELSHSGKDANALVKNLDLRFGYAGRYRNVTSTYSNSYIYGDALYGTKLGIANVNVKGAFGIDRYAAADVAAGTPNSTAFAVGAKVTTDTLPVLFAPSLEGQVGYYSRAYDYGAATANYTASGLKYVAGVKLNSFLLPNTKFAVYYAGLRTVNRAYTPYVPAADAAGTAGFYADDPNGVTTNQNGLYGEVNYYDLAFAYGRYTLSQTNAAGDQIAVNPAGVAGGAAAVGQTFKISYKVSF